MRRSLCSLAAMLLLGAAAARADSTSTRPVFVPPPSRDTSDTSVRLAPPAPDDTVAVFETVRGRFAIQLAAADAPRSVANFKTLVARRFYDGTYFHSVIPGFKIQGGDPNTLNADPYDDGKGGPGYTLPAEVRLPHVRGAVACARLPDAANPGHASNGSQFFIDLEPQPVLDRGGYTVFGQVVRGMAVVDAIAALADLPGVLQGPAGPDPQKRALVTRAYLTTLARFDHPRR